MTANHLEFAGTGGEIRVARRRPPTPEQAALLARIEGHALDQPGSQLPFTRRLARENAWTPEYAARVVREYRRFVFLSQVAHHPVTPSDAVDQAWHLHLTYTRRYWRDFCEGVLGAPLHHEPTRGGAREDEKFVRWYEKTLDSYAAFFGHAPPADVWPAPEQRFRRDVQFARVDLSRSRVSSRPSFRALAQTIAAPALLVLVLLGCTAQGLDGSGHSVLGPLVIFAVFVGVLYVVHRFSRSHGGNSTSGGGACGASGDVAGDADIGGSDAGGGDAGGGSGCGGGGCGGGGCGGGD